MITFLRPGDQFWVTLKYAYCTFFLIKCTSPEVMHWRRKWQPTPVFLPRESQGWQSLVGCRLWGHTESDTTQRLRFLFSLSCIGEGNGNSIQRSCLENPRDGRAWWVAVYGFAQSWTQLKRLNSSRCMAKPIQYHKVKNKQTKQEQQQQQQKQ